MKRPAKDIIIASFLMPFMAIGMVSLVVTIFVDNLDPAKPLLYISLLPLPCGVYLGILGFYRAIKQGATAASIIGVMGAIANVLILLFIIYIPFILRNMGAPGCP